MRGSDFRSRLAAAQAQNASPAAEAPSAQNPQKGPPAGFVAPAEPKPDDTNAQRAECTRMEAMLAVADQSASLIITGNGDVLEPEHGIVAIGSGGGFAQAAARALTQHSELTAREIVAESLKVAGEICIYTNQNHVIEELTW
mgnify:CR=1 FL=1